MGEKYLPPAGPGSNNELVERPVKSYKPPVGPDSNSVPPSGDFRNLPPSLLPKIQEVKE